MSRLLLSELTHPTSLLYELEHGLSDEVSHHDADDAFLHVYYVMLFIALLWFVGELFQKVGMPALVGQIIIGIVMGPNALNLVGNNGSEFLIVIGEIGLIMLVVEAGIDVDIGMLKLIGPRGLVIAVLGSIIPMSIGVFMSIFMGESIQASIAIGACFAPTSMGIALNVLKKAKILNTPTGQLIIAAAILDDVIALIILSELSAMKHPTVKNIVLPLVVSPVLILVIGFLSIRYIPRIIKIIMSKIPEHHHGNSILLLLFTSTFLMVPACHFAGSSYLLGAFLSGMMFCTDHTIHHVWSTQIKRILYWILRIFFACTIGFAIPVQEFRSWTVIIRGLIYCLCGIGKIVTGCFGRPLKTKEFFTIGFSMSAWGEFAFILATASFDEGTFEKEAFSAVLLAVLLSVIISPYCLRLTLSYFEKQSHKKMNAELEKYQDSGLHPVYFAINTKARGGWGHQDKILHNIFELSLEIIDFRSWHAPEFNYSHHQPLTKESFYVQDENIFLPPTKHLSEKEKERLKERVKEIRGVLKDVLGEKAIINIKRWLPGVSKKDDTRKKSDAFFGENVSKHGRRPSYCRREAFKQAHQIMSRTDAVASSKTHSDRKPIPTTPSTEDTDTKPKPKPKPKLLAMSRQLSAPDVPHHSGSGHQGQAKGVGALPFTNNIINVYDHWGEKQEHYRSPSQFVQEQNSDDEISYLYGDEDAEHHQLPEPTGWVTSFGPVEGRKKSYSLGDISDRSHGSLPFQMKETLRQITIKEEDWEKSHSDRSQDKEQRHSWDNDYPQKLMKVKTKEEDDDDDDGEMIEHLSHLKVTITTEKNIEIEANLTPIKSEMNRSHSKISVGSASPGANSDHSSSPADDGYVE